MNDLHVYIMSDQEMAWLLPGFAYLFNQQWGRRDYASVIAADGSRYRKLPDNFAIYNTGKPPMLYSDTLIQVLKSLDDRFIILMHGNDWIRSKTNHQGVVAVMRWAEEHPGDILRIDLTAERARCKQARRWKGQSPKGVELVYTPPGSEGLITFTPSIWGRQNLLAVLMPGESQKQTEAGASAMMFSKTPGAVMGVKTSLIDYIQVCTIDDQINLNGFELNTVDYMRYHGWLKKSRNGIPYARRHDPKN